MPMQDDWPKYCASTAEALKSKRRKFDMLVCSGISGQSVGFGAALLMNCPLIVVRKEPGRTGAYGIKRVIMNPNIIYQFWAKKQKAPRVCFIDDWIAQGITRSETGKIIHEAGGKVICQYLYARDDGGTGFTEYDSKMIESFGPVRELVGDPWT